MKTIIFAFVAAFCFTISVHAQTGVPPIVSNGLTAYKESGGKAALAVWLRGSPMENDTTTNIQMAGLISQIETAYGKMIGSELLRVVTVSQSFKRVYIIIKFQKGPFYASFDCYKAEDEWIIPIVDLNTKAKLILPPSFLDGSKP